MQLIKRTESLKKIISYKDHTGIIKVITGIRRCGKSTMFKLYQNYLLDNGVKQEQIIGINLDIIDNIDLFDYKKLYNNICSKLLPDEMNYIFLDEIQNVDNFQLVLNSLNSLDNVDLYVTGSNAFLLSGELATLLSGRYIQIKMYPLSFKECLSYNNELDKKQAFSNYIKYGSFPYVIMNTDSNEQKLDYLESMYNAILVKDIMQRSKISDVNKLKRILLFLIDNTGSLTSINNIKNQITSDNFKIDVATVESYIESLINSYILYRVPRYDIRGKELLKTNDKYYIADMGFKYLLLENVKENRGHILENVVYLELLRRGYKVHIGKIGNIEVDFIAEKQDERIYFQVSETLLGEETRERELKPLMIIKDNYEKILLTLDEIFLGDMEGIKHKNIIEWLVEEN